MHGEEDVPGSASGTDELNHWYLDEPTDLSTTAEARLWSHVQRFVMRLRCPVASSEDVNHSVGKMKLDRLRYLMSRWSLPR